MRLEIVIYEKILSPCCCLNLAALITYEKHITLADLTRFDESRYF